MLHDNYTPLTYWLWLRLVTQPPQQHTFLINLDICHNYTGVDGENLSKNNLKWFYLILIAMDTKGTALSSLVFSTKLIQLQFDKWTLIYGRRQTEDRKETPSQDIHSLNSLKMIFIQFDESWIRTVQSVRCG